MSGRHRFNPEAVELLGVDDCVPLFERERRRCARCGTVSERVEPFAPSESPRPSSETLRRYTRDGGATWTLELPRCAATGAP